jgi:RNA polymerase sigma-B factor
MADVAGNSSTSKEMWVEFTKTGEPSLRNQLIADNMDLARRLAGRFAHRGQAYDDLVQVASMALIKAVDRFDPGQNVEFRTFATSTIIGELKRHFRDQGWSVRAPRRLQELYLELGHAVESLSQQLGRSPTVRELADTVGASEEAITEAMEAGRGYRSTSIDAPGTLDASFGGRLAVEDTLVEQIDQQSLLGPALESLPERDREIVRLRFAEGLVQSEIAARVGISQMQVSRLLAVSLARLRTVLKVPPGAG